MTINLTFKNCYLRKDVKTNFDSYTKTGKPIFSFYVLAKKIFRMWEPYEKFPELITIKQLLKILNACFKDIYSL